MYITTQILIPFQSLPSVSIYIPIIFGLTPNLLTIGAIIEEGPASPPKTTTFTLKINQNKIIPYQCDQILLYQIFQPFLFKDIISFVLINNNN